MSDVMDEIEVVVLTHPAKEPSTPSVLDRLGWSYRVFENPDWNWPVDHPELDEDRSARPGIRGYALRQYRAFRGHQEILRTADPDRLTLVFEDDMRLAAGGSVEDLRLHLEAGLTLVNLGYADAISYHGRALTPPDEPVLLIAGRSYARPSVQRQEGSGHQYFLKPVARSRGDRYGGYLFRWHEGCLAYLTGPEGRAKWVSAGHGHGLPCDLFLANELNTLVLYESLFAHDAEAGSLIANTGPCRRELPPHGEELEISEPAKG